MTAQSFRCRGVFCCGRYGWLISMGLSLLGLSSCHSSSPGLSGYVEADWVYISAPSAGWITELRVGEGEAVSVGDECFTLDQQQQRLMLQQAQAQWLQAQAQWQDLQQGARAQDLAVLYAQLSQSQATAQLAAKALQRYAQLANQGLAATEQLDSAQTESRRAQAQVQALEAQIRVAKLGAREQVINGASAAKEAAEAAMALAHWQLQQRTVVARRSGRIEEVFLHEGDYAQAGAKVLALIPDEGLTVRFFLPQAQLHRIATGQSIQVQQDGQAEPVSAVIRYIAQASEFTPPVLYSHASRQTLVVRVEAVLPAHAGLHPGQPVDIRL